MQRFGFQRRLPICILLIAGLLLSGCGKGEDGNLSGAGNQTGDISLGESDDRQAGNGALGENDEGQAAGTLLGDSGQNQSGDAYLDGGNDGSEPGGKLYSRYRSFSMDMDILGMENQLLDMKCLAVEAGVYVAGARLNAGEMETAVYRIEMDQEPWQLVSIPQEKLLAWCRTEDGIAILGMQAEISEEGINKLFILHSFQGENLEDEKKCILTDAFAEAGISEGSFGAMAMKEDALVLSEDWGKQLVIIDLADGSVSRTIPVEAGFIELRYIDGETVLGISGKQELYAIYPETGGREVKSEKLLKETGALSHCMIGKDRIWGGSGQGLFAVSFEGAGDIGSANASGLMDYEYGLEAESSLWFSDEQEQGILASWNQEKRKVAIYYLSGREQETADADGRETVTLSGFFISEQIQKAVLEFNQSNDLYRIEVLDEDDRVEIVDLATRLETQLMAGKGADLLVVNTWTWFRDYVENGYLEDLAPYIERDLNPEDYVQSALYAYEKDGGVYALEASFGVSVLISDTRVTKGADSWTLPDMYRLAEQSGVPVFRSGHDTQSVLSECLGWLGSGIYDMDQVRECILFAEKYGDASADSQANSQGAVLGEDRMVLEEFISSPLTLADIEMLYGENAVMIGYPREKGGRFAHGNNGAISINKASGHKDGAWAFISFMLGRNYQFSGLEKNEFPVLKEAYEAMLAKYLKPQVYDIYLPEAGGIITVENKWTLSRSWGSSIESMTQEQIERLRKLVDESGVDIWYTETGAIGIICEEAAGYYQGNKPIEQVMEVIEGRLKIYGDM